MPEDNDNLHVAADPGTDLSDLIVALRDAHEDWDLHNNHDGETPKRKNVLKLTTAISAAGIDGEALVRYGLRFEAAVPLAIALAFETSAGLSPQGRAWIDALGLNATLTIPSTDTSKPRADDIARLLTTSLPAILKWVYNAPFTDIVTRTPPSIDVQQRILDSSDPPDEMCEQYRWIADRLGKQPPTRWTTQSLEAEYLWRRGQAAASLPDPLLIPIDVTTEAIAMELTDRRLLRDEPTNSIPPMHEHAHAQAEVFLRDHRYAEAAALFEFMGERKMLPQSDCLNNRGFCWIPSDPKRAMHYLQHAATAGYQPVAVNVYNQMCCSLALNDAPAIRAVSEHYWAEAFEEDTPLAMLWSLTPSGWTLATATDPRERIALLALQNAQNEGWPDRVRRWTLRLEALREGKRLV